MENPSTSNVHRDGFDQPDQTSEIFLVSFPPAGIFYWPDFHLILNKETMWLIIRWFAYIVLAFRLTVHILAKFIEIVQQLEKCYI